MTQRRPTSDELQDARRLLGVGPSATRAMILRAWRDAVRRNHPDATPEAERSRAEALCSRINAAKDMLLEIPPGEAPATTAEPTPARPPRGPVAATRPRVGPDPPRWAAPGTGVLLGFLVFGALALLTILAVTTRNDDAADPSRIGGDTTTEGVASPGDAMELLFEAVAKGPAILGPVTVPATKLADLRDMTERIARSPGEIQEARSTIRCASPQPGLPDRAVCVVEVPEDLLPHPVELRRDDQGWRLIGYAL